MRLHAVDCDKAVRLQHRPVEQNRRPAGRGAKVDERAGIPRIMDQNPGPELVMEPAEYRVEFRICRRPVAAGRDHEAEVRVVFDVWVQVLQRLRGRRRPCAVAENEKKSLARCREILEMDRLADRFLDGVAHSAVRVRARMARRVRHQALDMGLKGCISFSVRDAESHGNPQCESVWRIGF